MTTDGRPVLGSLFSGYGGLDMGVEAVLGTRTAWVSDIDEGACRILAHRYPDVPNLGDITAIDWAGVEPIDVLTGGFPCQDLSTAGLRRGMRPGTRSGLWEHMAYAIDVLRPGLVVAENVRGLLSGGAHSDLEPCPWCVGDADSGNHLRALGAVLGDLADIGYSATWIGLNASDVGAPHRRFRVFVVAWPDPSDAHDVRFDNSRAGGCSPEVAAVEGDRAVAADSDGVGWDGRAWAVVDRARRLESQNGGGDLVSHAHGDGLKSIGWELAVMGDADGCRGEDTAWGAYEPAIRQWERTTGRRSPSPTVRGRNGGNHLSPHFVEWMMGLPAGWVTDVPDMNRSAMLKALGNGVVWQQAAQALRYGLAAIARASEPVIA